MSLKSIKELLFRGLQGAVIGVFIIHTIGLIMMLMSDRTASFSSQFLISQYIASFLVGFTFGALNMLFVSERFNLIQATTIHFIGVLIVYIPAGMMAGWLTKELGVIISTLFIFIGLYSMIWLICYFHWKGSIQNINRELENRRK